MSFTRFDRYVDRHARPFTERLQALSGGLMSRGFDATVAQRQALQIMQGSASLQAAVMSFNDIFRVVAYAFLASLPLLLLMGKGASKGPVAPPVEH